MRTMLSPWFYFCDSLIHSHKNEQQLTYVFTLTCVQSAVSIITCTKYVLVLPNMFYFFIARHVP
jgi:hypothetical protein